MKVLVAGAGISGLGAAKFLAKRGDEVLVVDRTTIPAERKDDLRAYGATFIENSEALDALTGKDLLVISPTVTPRNPLLQAAFARGLPLSTEIDLALESYSGKIVAVTGTNGKSTVTAMIAHGLRAVGISAEECGNIGRPPTEILLDAKIPDVLVVELSSYQIDYSRKFHPDVTLFTSFSQDHLERHGTMERYFLTKWKLVQMTRSQGLVIIPQHVFAETGQYPAFGLISKLQLVEAEDPRLTPLLDRTKFPEWHNQLNAIMATYAMQHISPTTDLSVLMRTLDTYAPLPYRCQFIGTWRGKPVINDSKSTNVESSLAALRGQKEPVILLLGGAGKGESFKPILAHKDKIEKILAFGASREVILEDLSGKIAIEGHPTLRESLSSLLSEESLAAPILFSPGCASFDEFRNFEHRGQFFSECFAAHLVKAL